MKKLFALASMMIVISVSAQQPKMDKQEGKRTEVQQAKKDVDKRADFSKQEKSLKDQKKDKKMKRDRENEKLAFQKKQQHNKKDFPKGQKEVAYHPIKMR